jgi:hypothetical protein
MDGRAAALMDLTLARAASVEGKPGIMRVFFRKSLMKKYYFQHRPDSPSQPEKPDYPDKPIDPRPFDPVPSPGDPIVDPADEPLL